MNRQELVKKFTSEELVAMRLVLHQAYAATEQRSRDLPPPLSQAHRLITDALYHLLQRFDTDEASPAIRFLEVLWTNTMAATGHSWERLNQAMASALNAAISGGLRFDLEDFHVISERFRFGFWGGVDNSKNFGERFYSAACKVDNRSACHAWERYRARKPFIVHGQRLHLGSDVLWKEIRTVLTSFDDQKGTATLCAYAKVSKYQVKVTRVFTITPAQLRQAFPAKKRAKTAAPEA